jgi:multidrug efflux system outer membrane protein
MQVLRRVSIAALTCLVSSCVVGPIYQKPQPIVPSQFQAILPVPEPSDEVTTNLTNWWSQFDDPVVRELVDAAQVANPTIAQSLARIVQARANVRVSDSAVFPILSADVNMTRSSQSPSPPEPPIVSTFSFRNLDASWELDLFGASRKRTEAAQARLTARIADWQVTRVSLAAEVVTTLVDYRACEAATTMLMQDLKSREQTKQLTDLKVNAGFTAPADGALIDASVADARQRLFSQQAQCDLDVKALVSLTDIAEQSLRIKIVGNSSLPHPRGISVESVPAKVLMQRPDILSAERELAAASNEVNVAEADRYPHISILGSIGISDLRYEGITTNSSTWSFGPTFSLPLFDGGRRRAAVDAAQGRLEEARATYRLQVLNAVREIEGALVRLDSAARREVDAASAARDYARYFEVNYDKYKAGGGSLFELEEARRTMLNAQQALIGLQRDRIAAWIALYKALGGGWIQGNKGVFPQAT